MRSEIMIGREKEQAVLQQALTSQQPEMVAFIGKRGVGKLSLYVALQRLG